MIDEGDIVVYCVVILEILNCYALLCKLVKMYLSFGSKDTLL